MSVLAVNVKILTTKHDSIRIYCINLFFRSKTFRLSQVDKIKFVDNSSTLLSVFYENGPELPGYCFNFFKYKTKLVEFANRVDL